MGRTLLVDSCKALAPQELLRGLGAEEGGAQGPVLGRAPSNEPDTTGFQSCLCHFRLGDL